MIAPLPGDIFKPGQVLNNTYEIEGILGRGGTGEVYRARNQISGRIVALKALNAEFSGNADYLELMKREQEMRDIIHDAVVRYYDNSRTADGHVFLVMDFVDGPSLNDWLHRGNASPRDLLIVCHRVADGLVATHAHQIVHRDLSPDNIILRKGDPAQAVIIDFGIAKDDSAGARTIVGNDFAGKYEYAAPEQMDGHAEPRSDLYALGASLLAVYRGQVPNVGTTPGEVVRRKGKVLETEGVPEPLKKLIDWLTQPDAAQRPASAADVVAHLDAVLKPISRQTVLTKPASSKEKRRIGWGVIVTPLIFAGLATGVFYSGIWKGLIEEPRPGVVPEPPEVVDPVIATPEPPVDDGPVVVVPEPPVDVEPVAPQVPNLPIAAVNDLLGKLQNCGPLAVSAARGTTFAPDELIRVTGNVADSADTGTVTAALESVAAGRPVQVNVVVLNLEICRILNLLPLLPDGGMSISAGFGDTGLENFTGIFKAGDNPVADILIPGSVTDGHLWVLVADVTGTVVNLVPNMVSPETAISQIGIVEGGIRKVRVAFSADEKMANKDLIYFKVAETDFGKSMFIALISRQPLFRLKQPSALSSVAMAEEMAPALNSPDLGLTAVATQVIDLRN